MTNEELVKQIRQGNNELMGELYEQNKPVIQMIAEPLTNNQDEFEGALQDAYFGLVAAVKGYDESKGCKFITYAGYHIRAAINRGKSTVQHIPEYLINRIGKITRAERELSQQLQRTPTAAEIALKTGLTVEQIKYTKRVVKPPIALDTPLEEDLTLSDTIADTSIDFENDISEADERRRIRAIVNELPEAERQVIKLHIFQGLTYKETGQKLNISKDHVQRLIQKAFRLLRRPDIVRKLIDTSVDLNTSFYRHTGAQTFSNTWTSSTEQIVFDREHIREKLKEQYE